CLKPGEHVVPIEVEHFQATRNDTANQRQSVVMIDSPPGVDLPQRGEFRLPAFPLLRRLFQPVWLNGNKRKSSRVRLTGRTKDAIPLGTPFLFHRAALYSPSSLIVSSTMRSGASVWLLFSPAS